LVEEPLMLAALEQSQNSVRFFVRWTMNHVEFCHIYVHRKMALREAYKTQAMVDKIVAVFASQLF